VLDTQDFSFINPKARGAAKGQIDLASLIFSPMLVDLFTGNAEKAFMSINLQGPVGSPHPSFATNGSAGSSGILGVDPSGQVQPGVIQQVPGAEKLLKKLGIPGVNSGGTTTPSATGTTTDTGGAATTVQPVAPTATQPTTTQPTVTVPGLGDIQLPFGKKKKKKKPAEDTTTAPTTTAPATTDQVPAQ
jgi:hypothetical protein